METNEKLKIGIGTKEPEKLKPSKVVVVRTSIEKVHTSEGKEVGEKVVFHVRHPAREDLLQISSAKVLKGEKLKYSGIWFNLDEDELIPKNSVLSQVLNHYNSSSLEGLNDKEVETIIDDGGYLAVKAY